MYLQTIVEIAGEPLFLLRSGHLSYVPWEKSLSFPVKLKNIIKIIYVAQRTAVLENNCFRSTYITSFP